VPVCHILIIKNTKKFKIIKATNLNLSGFFSFLLRFLFFLGNFGMDINNLSAIVFTANLADAVLRLGRAAIFAQSQSGTHQCVMTPCIASLASVMSHSNYHRHILLHFNIFAK
jgi:hypothetical protein